MNKVLSSLLFLFVLTGCTTLGISPGENRGFSTVFGDAGIKTAVLHKWRGSKENIYSNLELIVHEGRVLIVGRVGEPKQQIEAVKLVWEVDGVKEVIDEMNIGEDPGIREFAKDSFITAQMKTELTFNENVSSLNYDYKTYGEVLYIIGIAKNEDELQHVLEGAQNLSGVKEIVNHVRIEKSDKLEAQESKAIKSKPYDGMTPIGNIKTIN